MPNDALTCLVFSPETGLRVRCSTQQVGIAGWMSGIHVGDNMSDIEAMQQLHDEPPQPGAGSPSGMHGSEHHCVVDALPQSAAVPAAVLNIPRPLLRRRLEDELCEPLAGSATVAIDEAGEVAPPSAKRRRLCTKQQSDQYPLLPAAADEDPTNEVAAATAQLPGWRLVRDAKQLFAGHCLKNKIVLGGTYEQKRSKCFNMWQDLDSPNKKCWIEKARARVPPPVATSPASAGDAVEVEPTRPARAADEEEPSAEDLQTELRPAGFLLTFNGDWGQQIPEVACVLRETRGAAWRVSAAALQKVPALVTLFAAFTAAMREASAASPYICLSCAMEASLHSSDLGRIHLHAFATLSLAHRDRPPAFVKKLRLWHFQGKKAGHVAPCLPGRGVRSKVRAVTEGHYYLQAEKIGSVLRWSNYVKNQHFAVQARMVLALWRLRKLETADARREIVASRDRAFAHVLELERQAVLEYDEWCLQQEQLARSSSDLRPFKPPRPDEEEWLSQYVTHATASEVEPLAASGRLPATCAVRPKLRRYETLVYDGPSRTGKSERAAHWFTEERTLKVNCQGVGQPNMRPFLTGQYDAVLCEEATWDLLWRNRQLFQASPHRVQLGQSPCNEHCYSVFCWGVPFLLCSNNFWEGCDNEEARAWVRANIVYVRWETPTWQA